MTWEYTGNPDVDQRDAIRFLVGDTDPTDQLISDEEILFLLDEHGETYTTASYAAEAIAAKFAREFSVDADGVSVNAKDAYHQYVKLAHNLRDTASSMGSPTPYFGGASKAERRKDDADTDLIPLHFRSHMHDNPDSGAGPHASKAELAPDQS